MLSSGRAAPSRVPITFSVQFFPLVLSCFPIKQAGFTLFFCMIFSHTAFRRGGVTKTWNPVIDYCLVPHTAFSNGGTYFWLSLLYGSISLVLRVGGGPTKRTKTTHRKRGLVRLISFGFLEGRKKC
ncbi:hypothetical protein B0T20DRAFT_422616 [Sordaria brevicollis]|uniref:Uncharacterized protein n=1 Tax=Sordaria brevicollis TaxID=83679 RepID=A0AAE0P2A4_SORBR|nr:hypothetical protein B0T20DRAFT_422616 [Sordaria brevicollis]